MVRRDTDGDGVPDGLEVLAGTNPVRDEHPHGSATTIPLETPPISPLEIPTTNSPDSASTIHVSTQGVDNASGSAAAPLRTIAEALVRARPGDTVLIADGSYPYFEDRTSRSGWIDVVAEPGATPVIEGAGLKGSTFLRLRNLTFSSAVMVSDHPTIGQQQIGHNISFVRVVIATESDENCLAIRDGSTDVSFSLGTIRGCKVGIAGSPETSGTSSRITISRSEISDLRADGIQFGDWTDVVIDGNHIHSVDDPLGLIHNDGIQVTGSAGRIAITNNRIHDSGGQLIFLKPNYGPIDDVLVENNVLFNSGAWAVQNLATNARFLYNTIWGTRYGALVLPKGFKGPPPTDTVVVGNVLDHFEISPEAGASRRDYNFYGRTRSALGVHETVGVNPGFANEAIGDLRLLPGAPGRRFPENPSRPPLDSEGLSRAGSTALGAYR